MSRSAFVFLLFLFFQGNMATAQIYKWIDENGKVQYGDRLGSENAEELEIKDKYIIPAINKEKAIPYSNKKPNRMIALVSITLNMPRSEYEDVRIGRQTCGIKAIDYYWKSGIVNFESAYLGNDIAEVFSSMGYAIENSLGQPAAGGSVELRVKLINLKLNLCSVNGRSFNAKRTKNASFVSIEWELYDPALGQILATEESKGSHDALSSPPVENGTDVSFGKAMGVAANNLLAKKGFVSKITSGDLADLKENFNDAVNIQFSFGSKMDSFNDIAEELKQNSAVIKSETGHGSGVLINGDGYILTNAHVVGDETEFTALLDGKSYRAFLVRKERIRDVALLKMKNYNGLRKGVKLAEGKPNIGEDVFVIGTPLKLEFEHSITKGIISAKRNIGGLPFLQTDAAVNHGNSGGPVFDESGELIALTVSGMFTKGGASLNINYLIPIDDAVASLNLNNKSKFSNMAERLKNRTLTEKIMVFIDAVDSWLNEPLITLH